MAQVFSGKVVIPGDQFEAYLQQLVETEKAIAPFREQLEKYNQEFGQFLASKYVPRTVRKHTNIVDLFIHFICVYTDVKKIDEITKGMVNSYFRNWYKRKVMDSATDNELKVALRKFFQFLSTEKGITHQKVLDSLK